MSENKNGKNVKKRKENNRKIPDSKISSNFIIFIFALYFGIGLLISISFFFSGIPVTTRVDPEIINGILTVCAVVFGFSSFQIELKKPYGSVVWAFLGLQAATLGGAGFSYYSDFLNFQSATCITLLSSMSALNINLVTMILIRYLAESWSGKK